MSMSMMMMMMMKTVVMRLIEQELRQK